MPNLTPAILQHIIKYLKVEEIYGLLLLNKDLITFFKQKNVIEYIIRMYYPQEIFEKIQPDYLFECLKSIKQLVKQELPFWGIETNAGLFQNSLRFWIGKSFMKTKRPQVALRKSENAYISGTLALDQLNFKKALVDYNLDFEGVVGKNTMMNLLYDSDNDDSDQENYINEQYIVSAENIRIFDTFRSFYFFFHYVEQAADFDSLKYLQHYAQSKSEQIHKMVDLDFYHLVDNQHLVFQTAVSYVQQIEIDRKTEFNQIVQTLFLFTSQWQYIPNKQILNCQTPQQLCQLVKSNKEQFIPTNSNIKLLQDEFKLEKDVSNINNFLYCEFKPLGDVQPLLWMQFINPNSMNAKIEFNHVTQRLAKSISVHILSTFHQENFEYDGVAFSYISLKGLIINEVTCAFLNQL